MKSPILILISLLIVCSLGKTQDLHFAQPLFSPLQFNPAMTGYMQGQQRLSLQHRAQWWEVAGRDAFQTTTVSYDRRFCGDNTFAGGIQAAIDQPFGNPMSNYQLQLSGAYHQQLSGLGGRSASDGSFMAFGLQAGVLHYRLQEDRLRFEDQFNPILSDYDPTIISGENFPNNSVTTLDVSVGLLYYTTVETFNYTLGFSIHHINTPRVVFLNGQFLDEDRRELPLKWTASGRVKFGFNDRTDFMIEPFTFFQQQGKQWQWVGGLLFSHQIAKNRAGFSWGGSYRTASHWEDLTNFDALIAQVIFDYKQLSFALAYEFNLSDLSAASRRIGGVELGLTYQFGNPGGCPNCPKFGGGGVNSRM